MPVVAAPQNRCRNVTNGAGYQCTLYLTSRWEYDHRFFTRAFPRVTDTSNNGNNWLICGHKVCRAAGCAIHVTSQDGRLPMGGQTYRQNLKAPRRSPPYKASPHSRRLSKYTQLKLEKQYSNLLQVHSSSVCRPHKTSSHESVTDCALIGGFASTSESSCGRSWIMGMRAADESPKMMRNTQVFGSNRSRLFDTQNLQTEPWHPRLD